MRFANKALSVGGLLLALTGLAGCGSSGSLLTADQANELKGQLQQVSQSLNARQCQQAANLITNFQNTVDGLNSVDQTLVANLNQGASQLNRLATRECPVGVVHQHTTTTQTTPTQTTTTPTGTQTTTTTTTTGPGSGGVGLSGGNGNGNGNGQANDVPGGGAGTP